MSNQNEQTRTDVRQKNVFAKPLHEHSSARSSPGAFSGDASFKTGFCNGQAPVAATITDDFLDFSQSRGLDLRSRGIQAGQRWCMAAQRWREARDSRMQDVPRVKMENTHIKALDTLGFGELKMYAADQDANSEVIWPGERPSASARQSENIGAKDPRS
ncbi:hypothetical protein BS50DRAFT_252831 [Corynespora cassiicola Philippines]|uniref:Uncharacterized protein n=1 Tax=Corynespora cassiicola Philippines TaxID=1448308 RepID=A0A2T2P574_CORCC|nr:hypothetical protein BS50DRAFT_252831 [Corynespora cassiicola Philippines]